MSLMRKNSLDRYNLHLKKNMFEGWRKTFLFQQNMKLNGVKIY
jgi:hypothetical protein